MTVRRLTQWTKLLCSRVAARLRLTRHSEHERQPAATGPISVRVSPDNLWSGVAVTHWLDDARRMRPRRILSIPLSQGTHDDSPGERPHRPLTDPEALRSASSVNSMPLSTDGSSRVTAREAQPLRPETSHDVLPVAPEPAATEAEGMDETLRRRLRSLQFLVRHGIYNEGFARNTLPEQYRRSAGMDDAEEALF